MISISNIVAQGRSMGFDDVAVVKCHRLDEDAQYMDTWLSQGLNGNMDYLERNREKRYDPSVLVPGGKWMIIVLLTYAQSGHDYHRTLKSKLYELEQALGIQPLPNQHIFVDSAPMLERAWAHQAGLGFIGRNRQLIHPTLGSMVHIGELVIGEEVEEDIHREPVTIDCGDCHKCIGHCPGHALGGEVWDPRLCVAYVTHKCMNCQLNCPYNESIE